MPFSFAAAAFAKPALRAAALALLLPAAAAAAGRDGRIVATGKFGTVTADEIDAWSTYQELRAGARPNLSERRRAEEVVVLRTLASRVPESAQAGVALAEAREDSAAAERLAREAVRTTVAVPEAEVRATFDAARDEGRSPRRWRLSDILVRVGPPGDESARAAARARIEAIRARITTGEPFAALAATESESSTRERGGAAGFVALADLRPDLAAVVRQMRSGDLSDVLEIPGAFVLLSCGGVDEPRDPDPDEVRRNVSERLAAERFEVEWAAVRAAAPGDDPTRADLAELRARSAFFRAEAARRGVVPGPEDRLFETWSRLEARAQIAANALAAAWIQDPAPEEIAADWRNTPERFTEPRKQHLTTLTLTIDPTGSRSTLDRFLALAPTLAHGDGDLPRRAGEFGAGARFEDLGWLTDDEIWSLGLAVDRAVHDLAPGSVSGPVREGRRILYVQKLAVREGRRLTLDEAAPAVRQRLLAIRRSAAGDRLRSQILEEAALTVAGDDR